MVLDTAANFVRSDVDSQVASGATTVSVVNASPFPDPSTSTGYNCVLWDASLGSPYQDSNVEVVRVTSVDYTNNDLTVTRAQEGTTDVFHSSTSAIQLSPTAKMMSDVDSSLETIADFSTNEVTADVNNSSVTTEELNTVRWADAGEVQSKLTEVGNLSQVGYGKGKTRGLVRVKPGVTLDPGSTITVPVGVDLDASQATFEPSSDYDLVFLDNAARAWVNAITDRSFYTSRVVYIDTSESTNGKYVPGQEGGTALGAAVAHINHWGDPDNDGIGASATVGGETAALVDSAGLGIYCPHWTVNSKQAGTGIRFDVASGGWINTPINVFLNGGHHTAVRHTGSGSAQSSIFGSIQCSGQYGIRNETTSASVTHTGSFWDPNLASTAAIAGQSITIKQTKGKTLDLWPGKGWADGSALQIVRSMESHGITMYNGTFDSSYKIDTFANDLRFFKDGNIIGKFAVSNVTNGVGGVLQLPDGNGNFVDLFAEGGELKVTDNGGTTTTLS